MSLNRKLLNRKKCINGHDVVFYEDEEDNGEKFRYAEIGTIPIVLKKDEVINKEQTDVMCSECRNVFYDFINK